MGVRRFLGLLLAGALIFASVLMPAVQVHAQTPTPHPSIARLMETMTPEERVGQLFLVTFQGTDTSNQSEIYDLIVNHHIGGVVLQASNDNFTAAPNTLPDLQNLINDLQRVEWEATMTAPFDPVTGQQLRKAYIPLFVGISQDGDGYPGDQILSGLTPLPNEMAIGATWRPELAQQIGSIQGKELSDIGINLYFGPSLDVLESPNPKAVGDIGPRAFGGDPFWVGEMGRSYINGLHSGSDGKMLVVAKHFPGRGGSDRSPEQEVATVRKSLEQLKQVELAPFMAVTGGAPDALSTADGLLVSHIRYQGFQGNIRATTRPVSFDQSALSLILALPQFASWRENGGLVVSDDLGSRAVRSFYAPGNESFSPRLVVRDAFLAGNDLLYLGNIVGDSEVSTPYTTTLNILDFFTQRYREDPAFAAQVDLAVERILNHKYKLHERFLLSEVLTSSDNLADIGTSQQAVFEVARRSATLISPDVQELTTLFPSPPALRDRMTIITDTARFSQCSLCPQRDALSVNALEDAIVRLYGPTSGGQASEARIMSYTFNDLSALLDGTSENAIESDINRSNWILLALTDASKGQPEMVSRFMSERQDLLRGKHVILFSFTAPYYLDATDISKLTAYFCLYSKQSAFVDVAARLLYQELTPLGFSPVSVPGTGYELIQITSPNPDQIITLSLDLPFASESGTPTATVDLTATVEPTAIPLFRIGDTIAVRTGTIYDHNGHVVPDGTVVRFSMLLSGEGGGILQQVDSVTANGMAQASFGLENPGLVEIRASSEPATLSEAIQMDVSSGQASAITVIAPIVTEETAVPTVISPTPVEEGEFVTLEGYPRFSSWLVTMILLIGSVWLIYWMGSRLQSVLWGVRLALCTLLGGLVGFNYMALGLPGSAELTLSGGVLAILGLTVVGEFVGLIVAWLWSQWISGSASQQD